MCGLILATSQLVWAVTYPGLPDRLALPAVAGALVQAERQEPIPEYDCEERPPDVKPRDPSVSNSGGPGGRDIRLSFTDSAGSTDTAILTRADGTAVVIR